jgi:poly(3-hydroxybutyrate) depolymerase
LSAARRAGFALGVLLAASAQAAPGALPELKLDLGQTTVSGISSGAFMAVQMGVAHSASVRASRPPLAGRISAPSTIPSAAPR